MHRFIQFPMVVVALTTAYEIYSSISNNAVSDARPEPSKETSQVNASSPQVTPTEAIINVREYTQQITTPDAEASIAEISPSEEHEYELINQNPAYPSLKSRLQAIQDRRPDLTLNPDKVIRMIEKRAAWELTNQQKSTQSLLSQLNIKDPELLRFDREKIESLVIGDILDIPIKQTGMTYRMRVASVHPHPDGNITWRGYIFHDGRNYRASFTQNPEGLTIGGINTPDGHFTLEAHKDCGWITSSQDNIIGRAGYSEIHQIN